MIAYTLPALPRVREALALLAKTAQDAGDTRAANALNKADLLVAKGVYDAVAVSADGALLVPSKETAGTVYRVGETGCTCTAGSKGKPCWHALLAEAMILAREEVAAELDDEAYVLSLYTLDEGYFQP